MRNVGSGDKLARGAVRANFQTTEGGVTEEKWNSMFDFDPEEFKNAPRKSLQRSDGSNADVPSIEPLGESEPEEPIT